MRLSVGLLLTIPATSTLSARSLYKFHIGAFYVGGDAIDTIRQPNPGAVAIYDSSTTITIPSKISVTEIVNGLFDRFTLLIN